MNLTPERALTAAVKAQSAGKNAEAERIYISILQAQPNNCDANHNLGILRSNAGKHDEALELFKNAVSHKPTVAQFWYSYVNGLVKAEMFFEAQEVLQHAFDRGANSSEFSALKIEIDSKLGHNKSSRERIVLPTEQSNTDLNDLSVEQAIRVARRKEREQAEGEARVIYKTILNRFPGNKRALSGLKKLDGKVMSQRDQGGDLPPKDLESVIRLYDSEKFSDAQDKAKSLLKIYRNSIVLLNILGLINNRLGNYEAAVKNFHKANSINPNSPEVHYNLGNSHKNLNRFADAVKCYKAAIKLDPKYADAYNNLGNVSMSRGDSTAAIKYYEKAIEMRSDFPEAFNNLGNALRSNNKLDVAINSYSKACELRPNYLEAYNNLGIVLRETGDSESAMGKFQYAIDIAPEFPEIFYNIGLTLHDMGDFSGAMKNFQCAIAKKADFVAAYNHLGNVLKDTNELKAATGYYLKAIKINKNYSDAYLNLSSIISFKTGDSLLDNMIERFKDKNLPSEDLCKFAFAIGKAYEDLNELDLSFKYLKEGNDLRKKLLRFDINDERKRFQYIKNFRSDFPLHEDETERPILYPVPIFIVGMTRSGTSLIEQIASAHSLVSGAGELDYLNRFSRKLFIEKASFGAKALAELRVRYLDALSRHSGGKRFVCDKMPQNFLYIGLICNIFPEAKIIHVKRDAAAICWSNYKQHYNNEGHGHCYCLNDIADYYDLYRDLMQFWDDSYAGRIYDLDYDKLTENQAVETEKLLSYLDIEMETKCLKPHENARSVRTASQQQVRRKVYQGSSKQWLKFKPFLDGAFDRFCD